MRKKVEGCWKERLTIYKNGKFGCQWRVWGTGEHWRNIISMPEPILYLNIILPIMLIKLCKWINMKPIWNQSTSESNLRVNLYCMCNWYDPSYMTKAIHTLAASSQWCSGVVALTGPVSASQSAAHHRHRGLPPARWPRPQEHSARSVAAILLSQVFFINCRLHGCF